MASGYPRRFSESKFAEKHFLSGSKMEKAANLSQNCAKMAIGPIKETLRRLTLKELSRLPNSNAVY